MDSVSVAELRCIEPDWPAPPGVKALVTTRTGGLSKEPYESFNLGLHVGDDPEAVLANRELLQRIVRTGSEPYWLEQQHGVDVVTLSGRPGAMIRTADAAVTGLAGQPCVVMTADCLPVLFCDTAGTKVGIAHAGWKGLCAGVLESTLDALSLPGERVICWLGPAISQQAFEVGEEVRKAFTDRDQAAQDAFRANPQRQGFWYADLYQLARQRLDARRVGGIYGGGFCTYTQQSEFFSYRRDGVTGRMASLIWFEE